jgi:FkbM family methyltransferase
MFSAQAIRTIGKVPLLSKAVRWYANRYDEGSVTTIRSGYAAGLRWRRHHRYVNGYWTGQFEWPVQQILKRELSIGDTFYDIGANAGFFALVAWNLVGPTGRVVAVDPDPANVESINAQIALNKCTNWLTLATAVADSRGVASFCRDAVDSSMARLNDGTPTGETFDVPLCTLDDILNQAAPPNFIKMDIEGAEVAALRGAKRLLAECSPKWLIELHNSDCATGVREILSAAGYRLTQLDRTTPFVEQTYPVHVLAVKQ